ncbi:MAG: type ISP restriction/modification enzyme [Endomicrobiaceae bacterium]|nr:type ISP restriction/modification enzyme [Endomicrobiaceae bacterium]
MDLMQEHIKEYISIIRSFDTKEISEVSCRTPLENLIKSIKLTGKDITIIHEGKSKDFEVDGTPDFFVYEYYDQLFKSLVGFIECKRIDYNLDKLIDSEQIARYSKTSENIIITNYRTFILLQKGKIKAQTTLLDEKLDIVDDENKEQNLINLLYDFYEYKYPYINTKKTLVKALANQSFYYSVELRRYIDNKSNETEDLFYKFNKLFVDFQQSMQYIYNIADFCDIYAQSLVYGLLLARLDTNQKFNEEKLNYIDDIPEHYKLLYEFLATAYNTRYLPTQIKKALTNIGKNLNLVDVKKINQEFSKNNQNKTNIAVYLYEDFLKEYDKLKGTENRKENGVYYTPKEVTQFITKSIQEILKNTFHKSKGYLDKNVKVLDFACGTGTFIDSVYRLMLDHNTDTLSKQIIKEKITNDIYGFELLFTPYIISHTILTKYLKDNNINLTFKERLPIYLTNTLDLAPHAISELLPNLIQEHKKAYDIKTEKDILAIIGNPPYFNGKSKAERNLIDDLVDDDYKAQLNEQNIRPLGDLYIKFIRFAEYKISKSGYGIVGIITNNSFLDGVTHRNMRKHLCNTFDEIYILNLHGSTRKGEIDKNIFDIMAGVSINILIKHEKPLKDKKLYYYSTSQNKLTTREEKLNLLSTQTISDVKWQELNPQKTDNYFFIDKNLDFNKQYLKFLKVTDIFKYYNSGIQSQNDDFCIHYSQKQLDILKINMETLDIKEINLKYDLKTDTVDWSIEKAKNDISQNYNPVLMEYRIFDFRYTSLSKKSGNFLARPRYEIMKHFEKSNIGLCFERNKSSIEYKHIFISNKPICRDLFCSMTYIAPLYIYKEDRNSLLEENKEVNFTKLFSEQYLKTISFKPNPEEILYYIYSVLHCPIYRQKYIEFLKTDFPSIPMTKNKKIFYSYSKLGKQLVELHTMDNIPTDKTIKVNYDDTIKNFIIDKIMPPTEKEQKLIITNKDKQDITFDGITSYVYNFEIGSHKPIDKWLKYRKEDKVILTTEDIEHIKNMIIVIKNTISIMEEIKNLNAEYLKDI